MITLELDFPFVRPRPEKSVTAIYHEFSGEPVGHIVSSLVPADVSIENITNPWVIFVLYFIFILSHVLLSLVLESRFGETGSIILETRLGKCSTIELI